MVNTRLVNCGFGQHAFTFPTQTSSPNSEISSQFGFYVRKAPLGTQGCGSKLGSHQHTLAIEFLVLKKTVEKKNHTFVK